MKNPLFDEFPSASAKQWKQKIQFDLNGNEYKTVQTKTNEGITIRPFYHQEISKQLQIPKSTSDFNICQTIFINNENTALFLAKDALKRGATAIKFIATKPFDFKTILKKVIASRKGEEVALYFDFQFLDRHFILNLTEEVEEENIYLNIDVISNLAKTGNWFHNKEEDFAITKTIQNSVKSNIAVLGVDVAYYQNSGANIVQQVAYALSHANEYLNFVENEKGEDLEAIKINFSFSVGSNYFFEIAKIRAFKYVWKLLLKEYDITVDTNIFVEPSSRNKALYDYNVNMLRTTVEYMSAILGGADTINNLAYDSIFHKKNEFGERISRNQMVILKEESSIKNADFSDGSYYVEELTYDIAEKALIIFKDIEKSGGFTKQLFKETIQRKIEESAAKEQSQFDNDEIVLLGINKYKNKEDTIKDDLELYPFVKIRNMETIIKPIIEKRLSESKEQDRLMSEAFCQ